METVRIVTDSNAFLSPQVLEKYPIDVIPHRIKVGGAMVEETSDFSVDTLFTRFQDAQINGEHGQPLIQAADINTILDVGANIGKFSRSAALVFSMPPSRRCRPGFQTRRLLCQGFHGRRAAPPSRG